MKVLQPKITTDQKSSSYVVVTPPRIARSLSKNFVLCRRADFIFNFHLLTKMKVFYIVWLCPAESRCSKVIGRLQDNCQRKNLGGKIYFAGPRSSVDRVSASGAEERSSSLRGGAANKGTACRRFLCLIMHTVSFLYTIGLCITSGCFYFSR